MGTPNTRSGAYLWLGTFAGVYVLVLTVFTILAAAWSSLPQHRHGNLRAGPRRAQQHRFLLGLKTLI